MPVLVVAVLLVHVRPSADVPLRSHQIIFEHGAATPDGLPRFAPEGIARRHRASYVPIPFRRTPPTVTALFPPFRIRRIRVVKYATSWYRSPEGVRQLIKRVWQSSLNDGMSSMIDWAEFTSWPIDLTIEFANGHSARFLTDGFHGFAEVAEGSYQFFRMRPSEKREDPSGQQTSGQP
jgi:hypothetical protein